jgi:hypothetical protein
MESKYRLKEIQKLIHYKPRRYFGGKEDIEDLNENEKFILGLNNVSSRISHLWKS